MRDLVANTTILVSRRSGANGAGANDVSFTTVISGDGNRVAFGSLANNLSNEDDDGFANVFVRDLASARTTLINRGTGSAGAPASGGASNSPAISPSGRFVAFTSGADNLSADDDNAETNAFLRDLDESTTVLASRANGARGAGADASAQFPVVSDNARVAFASTANNLSTDDSPFDDVFVRDVLADTTELVSRAPGAAGAAANAFSAAPSTSADGRYVAFQSLATTWSPGGPSSQHLPP